MKASIHPDYGPVVVSCSCGHSFETQSTLCKPLAVEFCAECHPFYTGKQKLVNTAGRVSRFNQKFANRLKRD